MEYKEKVKKLDELLDHWQDYFEPARSGTPGDDPIGVALLSSMAGSPPVVELVRCLTVCRERWPGHYKHLRGFYESEWRTVRKTVLVKGPNPKKKVERVVDVRERIVPGWVEQRMVVRAKDGVLWVWDPAVRLELPVAIHRAKTKGVEEVTDKDGTHLRDVA